MNKNEFLEKSSVENQNSVLRSEEILRQSDSLTILVLLALASIFFAVQIFTGGGINYGLYALCFSINMTTAWVKYFRLKQKQQLPNAIIGTIFVILLSIAHIYTLVSAPN